MNKKKIILLIISICLILCIRPIKSYYQFKKIEHFYQERNKAYTIIECPNCKRDVLDVEQFCHNCGEPLFEIDEQMQEFLDKVHQNLEPTRSEKIIRIVKKVFFYAILFVVIYNLLMWISKGLERLMKKRKCN